MVRDKEMRLFEYICTSVQIIARVKCAHLSQVNVSWFCSKTCPPETGEMCSGAKVGHPQLSRSASPLVPRPRCERRHCLQVAPLSPTSKTMLSVTLSEHLEDQELKDHVKWKGCPNGR